MSQDREAYDGEERPDLTKSLRVINIGLASFADELATAEISVVNVDWRPPAAGDAELADWLAEMGA